MTPAMLTVSRDPDLPPGHHEIERLIPAGAPWAYLDWPLPPPDHDGPITAPTIAMLCAALCASGRLAFRWDADEPPPAGECRFFPPRPRTVLADLAESVLHLGGGGGDHGVLTTGAPSVAAALFSWHGWVWGGQAVLVHDPAIADPDAVLAALRHGYDWRDRPWLSGVSLLFGPGHDGASAAVAAADAAALDLFLTNLAASAAGRVAFDGAAGNSPPV